MAKTNVTAKDRDRFGTRPSTRTEPRAGSFHGRGRPVRPGAQRHQSHVPRWRVDVHPAADRARPSKSPCVCPGDDTPICRWRCSVLAITRCRCLRARIGRARFWHSSVRRGDRPPWWTTKDQGQDGCREGERCEGRTPAQGAIGMTDCRGLSACECSKLVRRVTIVLGHADGPELWPR